MNKQVSAKSKYIDLKCHYVKSAITSKIIVLSDVSSRDNPPDMLKKVLALPTLNYLCDTIHLKNQDDRLYTRDI